MFKIVNNVHMDFHDSFKSDGWFDSRYSENLGSRFVTMKAALTFFISRACDLVRKRSLIVETGCQRLADDWGAGCSTSIFSEISKRFPFVDFVSVDIDKQNAEFGKSIMNGISSERTRMYNMDSVEFIYSKLPELISDGQYSNFLVYLDSHDYPIVEIANGDGKRDFNEGMKLLKSMTEEEFIRTYDERIRPSQEHCLKETLAVLSVLEGDFILLFDDAKFPGGGKPRLANRYLLDLERSELVLDMFQTLWFINKKSGDLDE